MATADIRVIDGDSHFLRGMQSGLDPKQLTAGLYRVSMNTVNKGGLVQCRPGYGWMFNMPPGQIQGGIMFRPKAGLMALVFAVAGNVYSSLYPFKDFNQIAGIAFRPDATSVFFEITEKSVNRNADGSLTLITPFKIVVMQDGFTPPAIWDGATGSHVNDPAGTKLGTHMKWSGDRLWVARGPELFAGDINNPLSFVEGTYLSNAKSFLLTKPITGMAEVTSNATSQLLVFTEDQTTLFRSNIRSRASWGDPSIEFQKVVFPGLGCAAHRSLVTHFGLLWWWSNRGLTNFDAAQATFVKSEFEALDSEMSISRGWLGPDRSAIALAPFDNYLLASVPHASIYNTHTWVLDKAPSDTLNEETPDAWNSFWTGTRPTDWLFGNVHGIERIFHFSVDLDGINRCWESFKDERLDNGCPITWTLGTRGYSNGSLTPKEFRWAEVSMSELLGDVDVAVFWAGGSLGRFKRVSTKRITAQEGIITESFEFADDTDAFAFKKQSRKVLTQDIKGGEPIETSCQIESEVPERIDVSHELFIVCSGPGAVNSVRMFLDEQPDLKAGRCEEQEFGEVNMVRHDGTGADNDTDISAPLDLFFSNKAVTGEVLGMSYTGLGAGESVISQADADKIAECHAQNKVNIWLGIFTPPYIANPGNPTI
jgi:hypothetical protein